MAQEPGNKILRTNVIIISIIVVLAALILWGLFWQNGSGSIFGRSTNINELPVNEDGLFEVIIPQNLFGGEDVTAEDVISGFLSNQEHQTILTNEVKNEDGSITISLTPRQLVTYKNNLYEASQFHKGYDVESIKEVIFENDLLSEITVFVDVTLYKQILFERMMCNLVLPTSAGTYQVLSGVPSDEWHTTITIKDADNKEVISITEFPHDDMYTIY
jgi:hypothetical protein